MSIIAIVGRPNVGKSTLFNRLTGTREAIVDEVSGVTRDRNYGKSEWNGVTFSVIDTGGYVEDSEDIFEEEINRQVALAIDEADAIIFLTDVTTGVHELDKEVANLLRRSSKKVFLTVNKVDNNERLAGIHEFYTLGLGDPFPISSINGSGTGDLLDDIVKSLPPSAEEENDDLPRVAIVGRPNVGKSSLLNSLLGEERNIVTPLAGTTRDSIYTLYKKYNHSFLLVDTAGIRKKARIDDSIEFYSVMRAIKAIEHSDVCLLMIDATRGIEAQDINIFSLIQRNSKGVIVLVNKWDLVEKDTHSVKIFSEEIRRRTLPFTDYDILFISALSKQRIHRILDLVYSVNENRKRKIATSRLNEVMLEAINSYPPPAVKGKHIKIKYVTQLPTLAPSFAFFCNLPQYIREPYKRYLENRLRENFDLKGVPVKIFFRKK
ncbi:MAG TPA: ribosome biogenesis GTPase Der [Bacteroidales bacterium]|nr:ribosome biogenesis GTPase Der [Bacteroidales bacterium]HRR93138.1 ribosome biogenesis GTPase Der [Bacteroidales bacterium]HRT90362.1 ribosome biogenesis GTPase Der [Bacteroidales bacterium]